MENASVPVFFFLAVHALAQAEIMDRIAVSAGLRVITSSDIDREIRVVAFLAGKAADVSPAARRAAAGRLVEQRLIQRELEASHYPVPSASEVEPVLDSSNRSVSPPTPPGGKRWPNKAYRNRK